MRTAQENPTQHPTRRRRAVALAVVGALSLGVAASACPTSAGASSSAIGRVDLEPPTFTNPTEITNPLFPIGSIDQAVQLGTEGDVELRHEITLLDETRFIRWDGQDIETVVSQFVAYGDGEILETATDYFAQADDGSVWYLGEDVTNYDNGRVENHDGTWLAGRDGPAGMIMPADPQVGDVYRPENIPGFVFEEVTVQQIDLTVDGPTGPVPGAILVQERLMDGTLEDKVFAPGYGEFSASVPSADELVTVAVAIPTDENPGRTPAALDKLSDTAGQLFDEGALRSWTRLESLTSNAQQALAAVSAGGVPPLLDDQAADVLEALTSAVAARSRGDLRQAALELELAALDLEMQYTDPQDVDEDRIEVWQLQRELHRAAGDSAAARSDRVILMAIKDRLG